MGATVSEIEDPSLPAGIRVGMQLVEISGVDVTAVLFEDALAKLKSAGRPLTLKFAPVDKSSELFALVGAAVSLRRTRVLEAQTLTRDLLSTRAPPQPAEPDPNSAFLGAAQTGSHSSARRSCGGTPAAGAPTAYTGTPSDVLCSHMCSRLTL